MLPLGLAMLGSCLAAALWFLGRDGALALGADAVEEDGGRLVVAALLARQFGFGRDQFAPERLGQYRLRQ